MNHKSLSSVLSASAWEKLQTWIRLVEDNVASVINIMISAERPHQRFEQMHWKPTRWWLHFPIIWTHNWFASFRGFLKIVVWDLREKMMDDMSADVMVNFVENAIVAVQSCKASSQVAPLLSPAHLVVENTHKLTRTAHSLPVGCAKLHSTVWRPVIVRCQNTHVQPQIFEFKGKRDARMTHFPHFTNCENLELSKLHHHYTYLHHKCAAIIASSVWLHICIQGQRYNWTDTSGHPCTLLTYE